MRFLKIDVPRNLLDEAHKVGSIRGFELYIKYVPAAKYSDRAIVYVYAKSEDADHVAFTQVSTIRRSAVENLAEEDVERWLTLDALSRAKHRIIDSSYTDGGAYAIELNELQVE